MSMNRMNLFQNHRVWLVAAFCLFVNVSIFAVSEGDTFINDNFVYKVKANNEVALLGFKYNFNTDAKIKEVIIPDVVSYGDVIYSVTSIIGGYSYFNNVEKIVFGKNIKEVGERAFDYESDCLKVVVFNEGLQKIGSSAFSGCYNLETAAESKQIETGKKGIIIPDGVTVLGQYAFYSSSIESFDTGEGLTYLTNQNLNSLKQLILGKNIKKVDGFSCSSLVQIKCLCELPPACQSSFSEDIYNNTILYVQKGSRPWYYVGEYWKNFNTIVEKQLTREPCKAPIISVIDNKINITCDTQDADIYYSLKAVDDVEVAKYDEPIMPSTKYILTAYAKVDEFDVSETVSFPFTVIQEDPSKVVTIKADKDDASVAVNGKNILISTANNTIQPAIVCTTNGSLVYDGNVSGQGIVPVNQSGIYIVKAGNTTKKVLVK